MRSIALTLVVLMLGGCARNRVTGGLDHNYYDLESDEDFGRGATTVALAKLRGAGVPVDVDTRMLTTLRQMLGRITAVTEYADDFNWEIHLAETKLVNAWAAPGGKIMVFRGLIHPVNGLCQTEDELAGVIAHEVAHATLRHGTRGRSRSWTIWGLVFVPMLALRLVFPGIGSLASVVTTQGVNLAVPAYSRSAEREADRYGLIYMSKAGYDPRAVSPMWKRAAKKRQRGLLQALYGTHPGGDDRAAEIEAMLPEVLPLYEAAIK